MEDTELREMFERLEKKTDAAFASAEKARKYLLFIIIASAVGFILPLIGLLFAIPSFIATYSTISNL